MLNAKIQLDKRALDQLLGALDTLPLEYRAKFLLQAQKSSLKPVVKAAKQIARAKTESPTIASSIHSQKGRYMKATGGAYTVIEHRDKEYNRTRKLGAYTIPHKSNYSKIEHLILNGYRGGMRIAGSRERKQRDGSFLRTSKGANKQARGFVVQGSGGQFLKVKKIRVPRFQGHFYYDTAYQEKMADAERKFAEEVFDKLDKFAQKNGLDKPRR